MPRSFGAAYLLSVQADDLKDSVSAKAITARQDEWKADLPTDEDALWDWLHTLDDASRSALLAHCVSFGVNALHEKVDRYGGAGLSQHSLSRLYPRDDSIRTIGPISVVRRKLV